MLPRRRNYRLRHIFIILTMFFVGLELFFYTLLTNGLVTGIRDRGGRVARLNGILRDNITNGEPIPSQLYSTLLQAYSDQEQNLDTLLRQEMIINVVTLFSILVTLGSLIMSFRIIDRDRERFYRIGMFNEFRNVLPQEGVAQTRLIEREDTPNRPRRTL